MYPYSYPSVNLGSRAFRCKSESRCASSPGWLVSIKSRSRKSFFDLEAVTPLRLGSRFFAAPAAPTADSSQLRVCDQWRWREIVTTKTRPLGLLCRFFRISRFMRWLSTFQSAAAAGLVVRYVHQKLKYLPFRKLQPPTKIKGFPFRPIPYHRL